MTKIKLENNVNSDVNLKKESPDLKEDKKRKRKEEKRAEKEEKKAKKKAEKEERKAKEKAEKEKQKAKEKAEKKAKKLAEKEAKKQQKKKRRRSVGNDDEVPKVEKEKNMEDSPQHKKKRVRAENMASTFFSEKVIKFNSSGNNNNDALAESDTETFFTAVDENNALTSSSHPNLITSATNPFFRIETSTLVSFLPQGMRDMKETIKTELESMLGRYDPTLKGVLCAIENIDYGDGTGIIKNDLPHIHFRVKYDALVFRPSVGTKLRGVVNKCLDSHVHMLVYGIFNASIYHQILHERGYTFDYSKQCYVGGDEGEAEGGYRKIGVDDAVTFELTEIVACAGSIALVGEL